MPGSTVSWRLFAKASSSSVYSGRGISCMFRQVRSVKLFSLSISQQPYSIFAVTWVSVIWAAPSATSVSRRRMSFTSEIWGALVKYQALALSGTMFGAKPPLSVV